MKSAALGFNPAEGDFDELMTQQAVRKRGGRGAGPSIKSQYPLLR